MAVDALSFSQRLRMVAALTCAVALVQLVATPFASVAGDGAEAAETEGSMLLPSPPPTPVPSRRTAPASLATDGFSAVDYGSLADPPIPSAADCCDPLPYPSSVETALLVAGLRYRFSLISSSGALTANKSAALLRLVLGGAPSDDDQCEDQSLIVTDFAETPSAMDGQTAAVYAEATVNLWEVIRVPYSGTYGLCYSAASDPGFVPASPAWLAVPTAELRVFGAPAPEQASLCSAEAMVPCVVRVGLASPTARTKLVNLSTECGKLGGGFEGGSPLQPFERHISMPVMLGADTSEHNLGGFVGTERASSSYRICLCAGFEFDTSGTENVGNCRSADVSDFPQSLGYLHIITVSTSPSTVYPGRRFALKIHCGALSTRGGCSGTEAMRIRLIDDVGLAADCGAAPETEVYASPANCHGGLGHRCSLPPSLPTTWRPEWRDLVLHPRFRRKVGLPFDLGVCYCGGSCEDPGSWLYVGRLAVAPFRILPSPLLAGGLAFDLRLLAPGAEFDAGSARASAIKLVFDPDGALDPTNASACASAEPAPTGATSALRCRLTSECAGPSQYTPSELIWAKVVLELPAHYAVCYCDFDCDGEALGGAWNFVAWQLAPGPLRFFAGTRSQGAIVFAGSSFGVTIEGVGLSASDRIFFLLGEGSLCNAASGRRHEAVSFSSAPPLPALRGAAEPGDLVAGQGLGGSGLRMTFASNHGLAAGDRVRFSDVRVGADGAGACPTVALGSSGENSSQCVDALVAHDAEVLAVESDRAVLLNVPLGADEAGTLDLTAATWVMSAQENFTGLHAPRGIPGRFAVCWTQEGYNEGGAGAGSRAGTLEVRIPPSFASAFHVTTAVPGVAAPSVVAFATGSAARYGAPEAQLGLTIAFRDASRVKHAFRADDAAAPRYVARAEASQRHCGRLFRELWSEDEDGFPQPEGCYYDEALNEYGMLFARGAGLRPGTKYQVALMTVVTSQLIQEHDWHIVDYAVPDPIFAPIEIQHTAPDTWGDAGAVASATACQEVCSQLKACNVAVYHADTDYHCLVADFSQRFRPFAVRDTRFEDRTDITMFMLDRLNETHQELEYSGPVAGKRNVAVDLFSMDDLELYPFGVIETSEAASDSTAALQPAAPDPRWHLDEGLRVLVAAAPTPAIGAATRASVPSSSMMEGGDAGAHDWLEGPAALDPSNPELRMRLRAAPGAPIVAGSTVRLILWPVTQWALPRDCRAECTVQSELHRCGFVPCTTSPLVESPWHGSHNEITLTLPDGMTPISHEVMHTIRFSGRHIALPEHGFLPTRFAAEVIPPGGLQKVQHQVSYTLTSGALAYVPVPVAGALLIRDGDTQPFAGDNGNTLYLRLRFGSVIHAGPLAQAVFALFLPTGYACRAAGNVPHGLASLRDAAGVDRPEARGPLLGGAWSFSGGQCSYRLAPGAAVYGGSSIMLALTVDNPGAPLPQDDVANTWGAQLTAPGDAAAPLELPAAPLVAPRPSSAVSVNSFVEESGSQWALEASLFRPSATVFGRLQHASLTPTDFWSGAPSCSVRVFFRALQATGEAPGALRLEAPEGFSFHARCVVEDLPRQYYRPLQGPYSSDLPPTSPLSASRRCLAFQRPRSSAAASPSAIASSAVEARFDMAEIQTENPFLDTDIYAFALTVLHPRVYELSEDPSSPSSPSTAFVLTTYAGTGFDVPLDRSDAVPLLPATANDVSPSYGIYSQPGDPSMLRISLTNALPFAYSGASTPVTVRFRAPLDTNSSDPVVQSRSVGVSWRVFAPEGYAWSFSRSTFFYRQEQVSGITGELPIIRPPFSPLTDPRNRLDFDSGNQNLIGWLPDRTYGFRAQIRVPAETPRHTVNEWIIEFGWDASPLERRSMAVTVEGAEVRALHSFYAWSLLSMVEGESNELMLQFGTVTTVPAQEGAMVLEAPLNFIFEAACVPFNTDEEYPPYSPLTVRLDCRAQDTVFLRVGGVLRPKVFLRPVDEPVLPGFWSLRLACVNPPSAADAAGNPSTFVLRTYAKYTDEANREGTNSIADVSAFAEGFAVRSVMPSAEIVSSVDYAASGRNDHPGQPSYVALAFELRSEPSDVGSHLLEVQAPEGFAFRGECQVRIGDGVFGLGRRHPEPYSEFEPGVQVRSCTGSFNQAQIEVTPGLLRGRLYAFSIKVNVQPSETPSRNEWRLAYAGEASAAIPGYRLWSLQGLTVSLLSTSTSNEAAPMDNIVEFEFTPTNTMGMGGVMLITGPTGYVLRTGCSAELWQVAPDAATEADASLSGVQCRGEQPPTRRAQVQLRSEASLLASGVKYRLVLLASNPTAVPPSPGYWTIETFSKAASASMGAAAASSLWAEPAPEALLDSSSARSLPILDHFESFGARIPEEPPAFAVELPVEFDFSLETDILANDVVIVEGPLGFSFAQFVDDVFFQKDLRGCIGFIDRPGSTSLAELPEPLCAGPLVRFFFFNRSHPAGTRFRFRAISEWPHTTLSAKASYCQAKLERDGEELPVAAATAFLEPIVPRFRDFALVRTGSQRAQALSSQGTVEISLRPSQAAQALEISSRMSLTLGKGADFAGTSVEVNAEEQVVKEVQVVRRALPGSSSSSSVSSLVATAGSVDGSNLAIAFEVGAGTLYTLILRGVENPDATGALLWTVRSFAKPRQVVELVVAASYGDVADDGAVDGLDIAGAAAQDEVPVHLSDPETVLGWLQTGNLRDETVDWETPHIVGYLSIAAAIESSFFDFEDTAVTFTLTAGPGDVPEGHRLLVVAPRGWRFMNSSFAGGAGFPKFEDLGILNCFDPIQLADVIVYIVRLSSTIKTALPCELNPNNLCANEVAFSLHTSTPPTPSDLERWRREASQAWLLQIDGFDGIGCGGVGAFEGQLNQSLMVFSNDALLPGFELKESMGSMVVLPEPGGQRSRQHITLIVDFEIGSPLQVEVDDESLGVFLKLQGVSGLEFDLGCLAAVPDLDYSNCVGDGALAVARVRERAFAAGEHRLALAATNPPWTPTSNWWTLESFAGVTLAEATAGSFEQVRQRGRTWGFEIVHTLPAALLPGSAEIGSSMRLLVQIRPSSFLEPLGFVELHAGQGTKLGCVPQVVSITMPPTRCMAYTAVSAKAFDDAHHTVELQLVEGSYLLPNNEYLFAVSAQTPSYDEVKPNQRWGLRLRTPLRGVSEATMEIPPFALTDTGMSLISVVPSSQHLYANNEIRMIISFSSELELSDISDIRVMAPEGWDFQPLCNRFQDITGGCESRCTTQLPYSLVRGHHICPEANLLFMLLDQAKTISQGTYTLLMGAVNPAAAPSRNWWSVALLSSAPNAGWRPEMAEAVYVDGLKAGQTVLAIAYTLGFEVGQRMVDELQASPLQGDFFEVIGAGACALSPHRLLLIVLFLILAEMPAAAGPAAACAA